MDGKPKIDRQREHQANERTFLAWVRTSIAMIGFGFAIARFGLYLHQLQASLTGEYSVSHSFITSQNLGLALVVMGIIVIGLSVWRHNQAFWQIERGDYKTSRLMVWLTATLVAVLGLLTIPILLGRENVPINTSPRKTNLERLP